MKRPRALDLFCGAGGAGMGLHRAGFDVTGVDIKPQPHYPFTFVRADAMNPPFRLSDFDLVWASPPCQGYSIMRNLPWLKEREYPMLIPAVRDILKASGAHYIIENVNQARRRAELPDGIAGGYLCGTMFGLPLYRHRRFETSFMWMAPSHRKHESTIRGGPMLGSRASGMSFSVDGGSRPSPKDALGVEWMTSAEAGQAIPPAYSEYLGGYAMAAIRSAA